MNKNSPGHRPDGVLDPGYLSVVRCCCILVYKYTCGWGEPPRVLALIRAAGCWNSLVTFWCVLNGSWVRLGRFLELTWSKLAPKMAPRGFKMLPRWAQEAPRCSKMLQDGPKMLPRWPQDAPRGSQDGPKRPQEAPKMGPRGPKMHT